MERVEQNANDEAVDPYARLAALGLELPTPRTPIANYVSALRDGSTLYVSGHGPVGPGGVLSRGKVGDDVSVEEAYGHARLTGLNILATLEGALGSLSRVRRILRVLGMVNATPGFAQHPKVIDGCSDLLVGVFGEAVGRHTRSAVGMGSLPGQITVEIELVAMVAD